MSKFKDLFDDKIVKKYPAEFAKVTELLEKLYELKLRGNVKDAEAGIKLLTSNTLTTLEARMAGDLEGIAFQAARIAIVVAKEFLL